MTARNKPESQEPEPRGLGDTVSRVAAVFYRQPRLIILSLAVIAVGGLGSLSVLPRLEDPVLASRAANVTTSYPGADAARVEAMVTEKLEHRLLEVPSIKRLRSQSRTGVSFIQIELRDQVRQPEAIWSEVRSKLQDATTELPPEALRPVFDQPDVSAYAWIGAIYWNHPQPAVQGIMRRLARDLRERLRTLPGTKRVDIFGDPGEEIIVQVDPVAAAAVGLSVVAIADQLQAADGKGSAGTLHGTDSELVVEIGNRFHSLEEIRRTPLQASESAGLVRLEDVAKVRRGMSDPPSVRLLSGGRLGVAVAVRLQPHVRVDKWFDAAEPLLAAYVDALPSGLQLETISRQDRYVNERLTSLVGNLLMACLAVAAVTGLIMGWRAALLVTFTLPIAGLMVLTGMRFLGIPIHQMSITGLIIALGLMIDNAIIVVDELGMLLRGGVAPERALRQLVRRLTGPLVASTVTTAFAFAPIAMMEGPAGEFVGSIAITVMLAIFSSLLLSLTVIPALAASLLHLQRRAESSPNVLAGWSAVLQNGLQFPSLTKRYRQLLDLLLRHPGLGIAAGLTLPLLGFATASQLQEQFFPAADRDQFHIELELDPIASLHQMEELVKKVDQHLEQHSQVTTATWFLGESAPSFYYNLIPRRRNTPSYAQGIISFKRAGESRELIQRLQQQLDTAFPAARILVRQLEQGPPFAAPIELRIFGPDLDKLDEIGQQLRLIASQLPDMLHVRSELSEQRPVANVLVSQSQARRVGLTERQISQQLFARLEGLPAGSVLEGVEEIPIKVRIDDRQRVGLERLVDAELLLATADNGLDGGPIPLSALSRLQLQPSRSAILRFDGRRINELQGYISAGILPSKVLGKLRDRIEQAALQLPPGYSLEIGGEASERDEAVSRLMANVSLLGVAMAAGLVIALASFRLASLIGLVAGMSVGLGLGSLWLLGYPFGFMAIIGTMGLIGVAINDSIVVVSRLSQEAAIRRGDRHATVEAIIDVTRHLLATTFTTIAGFLPLILAGGGFWPPLAVAIGGGVAGATLMSVTLVPTIYHRWIAGRWDVAAAA